jgi:Zn-dependent peptidase ImmA (M78 family)/transcriptional regulator with XRE-family HTH domain
MLASVVLLRLNFIQERRGAMPIDQGELGRRIRQAREACGMTQEDVAEKLGVSRATVAQIELGNRSVSGLELGQLAYLFARDIREFLAEKFSDDEVIHALFRSQEDAGSDGVKQALRDCIAMGHELTSLEELLGINRALKMVVSYPFSAPRSKWEAIQTGAQVAQEERRRLGLGSAPLGDLVQLLEGEGIRTGLVSMPAGVSGLTVSHPRVGIFVVINRDHPAARQRFSWCHEYSHVLLDRQAAGIVSREADRNNLIEVRANSFAANFLMPEEGVRQFAGGLGKGASSRVLAEIFDEAGVVPVDTRTEPGSQDLQLYDVVQMAHSFGVSPLSALYRLRNLRLLTEAEFARLKALDEAGNSHRIAQLLGLPAQDSEHHANEFARRFLGLALEAYRRDLISRTKLLELAERVNISQEAIDNLIRNAGLAEPEENSVLVPGA